MATRRSKQRAEQVADQIFSKTFTRILQRKRKWPKQPKRWRMMARTGELRVVLSAICNAWEQQVNKEERN